MNWFERPDHNSYLSTLTPDKMLVGMLAVMFVLHSPGKFLALFIYLGNVHHFNV